MVINMASRRRTYFWSWFAAASTPKPSKPTFQRLKW